MRLYGLAELASALGVSKKALGMMRHRGKVPPPDAELAAGPVWSARRIEPWIRERTGKRGQTT